MNYYANEDIRKELIEALSDVIVQIGLQELDSVRSCGATVLLRCIRDELMAYPEEEPSFIIGQLRCLEMLYLHIHEPITTIINIAWDAYRACVDGELYQNTKEDAVRWLMR